MVNLQGGVLMTKIVMDEGINHNGSLDMAFDLIDVAKAAGCHYVKFQKRHIPSVYTPEELAVPRESPWGTTTEQQKRGLEFETNEYRQIDEYCKKKGIEWFASAWDVRSAILMGNTYNVAYQKIPSALITNLSILEITKSINIPVIISTGMSTEEEIRDCVDFLGDQIEYILHCTSTYPSKPMEQNLKMITTLKEWFPKYRIGFSNHSPGLTFMIAAVALGAEMIEFHGTMDRSSYGSDQAASIEPEGVFKLCKYIRAIDMAMGDGIKQVYPSEVPILKKLRR
jgi:N-acetylneuraminate synthase